MPPLHTACAPSAPPSLLLQVSRSRVAQASPGALSSMGEASWSARALLSSLLHQAQASLGGGALGMLCQRGFLPPSMRAQSSRHVSLGGPSRVLLPTGGGFGKQQAGAASVLASSLRFTRLRPPRVPYPPPPPPPHTHTRHPHTTHSLAPPTLTSTPLPAAPPASVLNRLPGHHRLRTARGRLRQAARG